MKKRKKEKELYIQATLTVGVKVKLPVWLSLHQKCKQRSILSCEFYCTIRGD